LHKGLLAYTERDAPTVYERYSGIAEVAVTVLIALMSATFAGVRIYRMRRKNRIDVFYTDAMAIRHSVSDASTPGERTAAAQKIRALQAKAFEMLVDEQLAADESFRIFISLSNDVLQELNAVSA
jgi:serine phosphatase RsbU (regulator of sigma subunit)